MIVYWIDTQNLSFLIAHHKWIFQEGAKRPEQAQPREAQTVSKARDLERDERGKAEAAYMQNASLGQRCRAGPESGEPKDGGRRARDELARAQRAPSQGRAQVS